MTSGTATHLYFATPPASGDVMSAMGFGTVSSTAVVPKSGGAFTGALTGTDLTLSGDLTVNGAVGGDISTGTTNKIKQKGAFMQSSTHQALTLGY